MNPLLKLSVLSYVSISSLCAHEAIDVANLHVWADDHHWVAEALKESSIAAAAINPETTLNWDGGLVENIWRSSLTAESSFYLEDCSSSLIPRTESVQKNQMKEVGTKIKFIPASLRENFRGYLKYLKDSIYFLCAADCPHESFFNKLTEVLSSLATSRTKLSGSHSSYVYKELACTAGLIILAKLLDPIMVRIQNSTASAERNLLMEQFTLICQTYEEYRTFCTHETHLCEKNNFYKKAYWCLRVLSAA